MKKELISFISLITLISCSSINTTNSGSVKMDFKFPQQKGFSVKAIPASTDSFQVLISGEGLSQSIDKKITKDDSGKVLIEAIPTGNKVITVKALNSTGRVLAQAETNVEIKSGETNRVTMELKSLLKNFTLKFPNLPQSPSNTYLEVKTSSETIQQELNMNEIELKDIEPGDLNVKVTSYSDDATPLLNINKKIDTKNTNSEDITLEPVIVPKISDIDPLNPLSNEIQKLLEKVKIEFKNNTAPKIDNIELTVNGTNLTPSYITINPTCISMSDNVKFTVNYTDKDNDKVNFFWARNSSTSAGYKLNLYEERGSSLSFNAGDLGFGNYSIGLIATDKKSFIMGGSMYFNIREKCN